ncbi:MAG TPA: ABC transporter substrate-binding protein [Anaerolineae bacterium]|nr:ABC transporter substrate-binding protein [Anaerolineae bacterium]
MKKLVAVVAVIVALGLVVGACAPAPAGTPCPPCPGGGTPCPPAPECPECPPTGPTTDLGGREVRIALENAYPPFNYIDDAGEGVGWDYDVGRAICEKLNCTPVFVETAWEGLFEAMAAGENDVAFDGITINLPRSLKIDYSDPYVEYGQVIVAQQDDDRPELADEESFVASNLILGTQIGTTNEISAIKLVGEDRIESYETYDLPMVALMAGEVDAVIIDEVAAIGFIGANPGQLRIAFSVTSGELLAFIFQPMSDLVEPFNWALQEMFADGTMDQICQTWLLRNCSPEAE